MSNLDKAQRNYDAQMPPDDPRDDILADCDELAEHVADCCECRNLSRGFCEIGSEIASVFEILSREKLRKRK